MGFVVVLTITLAAALAQAGWRASELFVFYPDWDAKTNITSKTTGDLAVNGDFASAMYDSLAKFRELSSRAGKNVIGDVTVLSHKRNSEFSCSKGRNDNQIEYQCTVPASIEGDEIIVTGQAAEIFFDEMADVDNEQRRAGDGFACTRDNDTAGKPYFKCRIKTASLTQ